MLRATSQPGTRPPSHQPSTGRQLASLKPRRPERQVHHCPKSLTPAAISRPTRTLTRMSLPISMATHRSSVSLKSKAFLEGMSQQVAATLIYGNQVRQPRALAGLARRAAPPLPALTLKPPSMSSLAVGTGMTNTSIWIHVWGDDTAHGTFPKGKITGLQHRDMGEWPPPSPDANGNKIPSLSRSLKWLEIGYCLRDWRYLVVASPISTSPN